MDLSSLTKTDPFKYYARRIIMPSLLVDKRDVEFVLYEQLNVTSLTEKEKFEHFSKDEMDMIIEQALIFAENELAPINEDGDRIGAKWNNGSVAIPESFYRPLRHYGEAGWVAACEDPEHGGQSLPFAIFTACNEMFHAANSSLNLYPGLAHGTAVMIRDYGTEDQKRKYMDKLLNYKWAATMCLTEPGAGSSLAQITTKAVKIDDTHYRISGQKIFITGGDHDVHPNIIHPVLARIEGDPDGIRGISIFLVPKYHVNDDGTIGERNDITCAGIEHKMGIKASATCQLSFGDEGKCIGEILGSPRQGIGIMFLIMNEERLNVGVQALGLSSAAYLNALKYARERVQGVDVRSKDRTSGPVTIINHPDVRRNLMWMKSHVEGLRALNCYTGMQIDLKNAETEPGKMSLLEDIVELLTPVCKAYTSEVGFQVCSNAIQVLGGYGYCQDYPVEQFLRDCKITSIYEGTTAIHSIDLLSRKISMHKSQAINKIFENIDSAIEESLKIPGLEKCAENVKKVRDELEDVTGYLIDKIKSGNVPEAFLDSMSYLEVFGDTMLAWMHLWQLIIAHKSLNELFSENNVSSDHEKTVFINDNRNAAFYSGKVMSARFYILKVLPRTESKFTAIRVIDDSPLSIEDCAFGEDTGS